MNGNFDKFMERTTYVRLATRHRSYTLIISACNSTLKEMSFQAKNTWIVVLVDPQIKEPIPTMILGIPVIQNNMILENLIVITTTEGEVVETFMLEKR